MTEDMLNLTQEHAAALRQQLMAANNRLVAFERAGRELRELIVHLAERLK